MVKPPVYNYKPALPQEAVGLIQGQEPDSVEEWRTAQALGRLKVPFIYQFEIFDASIRGGMILDFLVQTDPLATPLEVDGEHWHSGERAADDIMRHVILEDYFRGKAQPLVILYGQDLATQELADSSVRRAIFNA
jgi:hypothetical protein